MRRVVALTANTFSHEERTLTIKAFTVIFFESTSILFKFTYARAYFLKFEWHMQKHAKFIGSIIATPSVCRLFNHDFYR